MTRREAIRQYHGGFHNALLDAFESGDIFDLLRAYGKADEGNQCRVESAFPGIAGIAPVIWNDWPAAFSGGLRDAFPGLLQLDAEEENPTGFSLCDGSSALPMASDGGKTK